MGSEHVLNFDGTCTIIPDAIQKIKDDFSELFKDTDSGLDQKIVDAMARTALFFQKYKPSSN